MKNNNLFNDINRSNIHSGYNESSTHYNNFATTTNNNFNNTKPNIDIQNQMNNTEKAEKISNANLIPLNSNYNVNMQNKINNFNKSYMNPHENNNINTNIMNNASNGNFHQNKNAQINNITTTNCTPPNNINPKIPNNENLNSKDINKINSVITNDSSSSSNTINKNHTGFINPSSYSSNTRNANSINNMNINNNLNYNMNANYNMHNKMISNTKPMINQYTPNMNAFMNMYQNNGNLNNSLRMPMYQPQHNMIYNSMDFMNGKDYIKHMKYNKLIVADLTIKPNETLYIKNLNDRIKPEEMKKNLKELFKQYGVIKDIIAMKSFWRKGQAWIIFDKIESATKALNAMQGYILYGKVMQINYSHNKSDIHSKKDGNFVERSKNPKKPKQIIEREQKQKEIFEKMHKNYLEMQMNNLKTNKNNESKKKGEKIDLSQMDKQTLIAKAQAKAYEEKNKKNEDLSNNNVFSSYYPINTCSPIQNNVVIPYKILFVENILENVNVQAFNELFENFVGFIEARIIPQRNVAFVDFSDESTATYAMKVLQNYELQGSKLKISYAKR